MEGDQGLCFKRRGAAAMPVGVFLKSLADGQQSVLSEWPADQLNRDRHTIGEAAWQGKRRETGQVAGWNERGESGCFRQRAIAQGAIQWLRDLRSRTKARGRKQHVDVGQ